MRDLTDLMQILEIDSRLVTNEEIGRFSDALCLYPCHVTSD